MTNEVVVGAYLERTGGLVMRATSYGPENGPRFVEPTHFADFEWAPSDPDRAHAEVARMAQVAAEMGGDKLRGIAIASYGPFKSLKRSNLANQFGVIQERSVPPLQGFNLREIFHNGIVKNGANQSAFMTVHTDAEACSIGESLVRGTGERHTLAFLLVTEGIGLGIVQGRRTFSSALHSEFGMLHVAHEDDDYIFGNPPAGDTRAYSLAGMASNQALRRRYAKRHDGSYASVTNELVLNDPDNSVWEIRAKYLAQACLSCTVLLAPHSIVVGTDLDREAESDGSQMTQKMVNSHFRWLLKQRSETEHAVFSYEELDREETFITQAKPVPFFGGRTSFRTTGALGMCHAAANSAYGAKHWLPKEIEAWTL